MNAAAPELWPEWPVCDLHELADPDARGFCVGEGDWPFRGFIVRKGSKISAYANVCPHRRHPLDLLPDAFLVEDGQWIRCSSHGALFDPDSGLCVLGPCQGASLMQLSCRRDDQGAVVVRAPASLGDALQIIGEGLGQRAEKD